MSLLRLGVVGAGAWGTVLASLAAAGGETLLWARDPAVAEAINAGRGNPWYLPGAALDPRLEATADLALLAAADALLLVTPAQHLRAVCRRLSPHLREGLPVVICAKGIEQGTGALLHEVVAATLPRPRIAALSGPTFAAEVAAGLPTAATLAAPDEALGRSLMERLGRPHFRPYLSTDLAGVEIGGAVKNVLAIACGIVAGRRLGDNARAALIARGLAEMMRLGRQLGARPETLMGLSGLGDLVLTCTSLQSRNYTLGIRLGEGQTLAVATAGRRGVAEGVFTAAALVALAARRRVELPVSAAVEAILHRGAAIDGTIATLLARPFKAETAD